MKTHAIEIAGLSERLLELLDWRVRQLGTDRSAYLRDLIRRDVMTAAQGGRPKSPLSLEEIAGTIAEETKRLGWTEEEIDNLIARAGKR